MSEACTNLGGNVRICGEFIHQFGQGLQSFVPKLCHCGALASPHMLSVFNVTTPGTGGCAPFLATMHHETNGTKAGYMLNKPAMAATGDILKRMINGITGDGIQVRVRRSFNIPMRVKAWPCEGKAKALPKITHGTFTIDHWYPLLPVDRTLLWVVALMFEGAPV